MANFEIHGIGKETNRKRKRAYSAPTEEIAIKRANSDGTIVDTVTRLPLEPATENQISLANRLEIDLPPNATYKETGSLLSINLGNDEYATDGQLEYAKNQGIDVTEHRVFSNCSIAFEISQLFEEDSFEYNKELIRWYVISVLIYKTNKSWDSPEVHDQFSDIIGSISVELSKSDQIIKSIKRSCIEFHSDNAYPEFCPFFSLIRFSSKTDSDGFEKPRASTNAIGYKKTLEALNESGLLKVKTKSIKSSNNNILNIDQANTQNIKLIIISIIAVIFLLIFISRCQ